MRVTDARSLSPLEQQKLRLEAVATVEKGKTHKETAAMFGIARSTVTRWVMTKKYSGESALRSHKRGRHPNLRLKNHQADIIVKIITGKSPKPEEGPNLPWTRKAVQVLIERRFHVRVSIWTVGRYLKKWGYPPHKHTRRKSEQNNQNIPAMVE